MPTSPTGGLSIFVNLAILMVGFIIKHIRKIGFVGASVLFMHLIFVDKKFDLIYRRVFGYSIAISVFLVVSATTSLSMYGRMTNESNYDYISDVVNQIKITLIDNSKPDASLEEKEETEKTPMINPEYVAKGDYLLALLGKVKANP